MKRNDGLMILMVLFFAMLCGCNSRQKRQDDCNDKAAVVNTTVLLYQQGTSIEYQSSDGRSISFKVSSVAVKGYVPPNTTDCIASKGALLVNDSMNLNMGYQSGYPGQSGTISSNISFSGFDFGYYFDILQITNSNPQGIVAPPTSYGAIVNEYLGDTTINGKAYKYVYATTVQTDSIYSDRKFRKFYLNNTNGLLGMVEKNTNTKWFIKS